jgi:hypothetical protein
MLLTFVCLFFDYYFANKKNQTEINLFGFYDLFVNQNLPAALPVLKFTRTNKSYSIWRGPAVLTCVNVFKKNHLVRNTIDSCAIGPLPFTSVNYQGRKTASCIF